MTTKTEFEKRIEERRIAKEVTKTTIKLSLIGIAYCVVTGFITANFLQTKMQLTFIPEEKLYGIVNLFVVLTFIAVLAVRRTIYFSPKLIKESFTVQEILDKWTKIDRILLTISALIPIVGLVLTFLGLPFDKVFHLFVGPGILMVLIMPVGIKIRSKLNVLREHFPENPNL